MKANKFYKADFEALLDSIDRDRFIEFYFTHDNVDICDEYQINTHVMYKLLKHWQVEISPEIKKLRTKIGTASALIRKYGTSNVYSSPEFKAEILDKLKVINQQKYGVDNPFQAQEIKDKIKANNLDKYGVEYTAQVDKVKEKIKQTNLTRYGVTNTAQLDWVKEKSRQTCLDKYGESASSRVPEIREKARKTCLARYGVESASQSPEIKEKIKQTNLTRYNIPYFCMSPKCFNYKNNSNLNQNFAKIFIGYNLDFEREFSLQDYVFDFKIGNYLIEIDPTITHNSTMSIFNRALPKDKYYHQNKSIVATNNGFFCVHIFDWWTVQDIIELLNQMSLNSLVTKTQRFAEPREYFFDLKARRLILNINADQVDAHRIVQIFDDGGEFRF